MKSTKMRCLFKILFLVNVAKYSIILTGCGGEQKIPPLDLLSSEISNGFIILES